jgi:hypothetical protein
MADKVLRDANRENSGGKKEKSKELFHPIVIDNSQQLRLPSNGQILARRKTNNNITTPR